MKVVFSCESAPALSRKRVGPDEDNGELGQGLRELADERDVESRLVECPDIYGNRGWRQVKGSRLRMAEVLDIDPVRDHMHASPVRFALRQCLRANDDLGGLIERQLLKTAQPL
jgi:hypothetical protein